jgi:hypothetical protein
MNILIVTFSLKDMQEQEYEQACELIAPAFAEVEGLLTKVWLAHPESNTYGGVYTFASETDLDRFLGSQLFADVGAHPNIDSPKVRRFQVLEEPTRVTHGLVGARS